MMVLSLGALAIAFSFTQVNEVSLEGRITVKSPVQQTKKRVTKKIRMPRPVMDAQPDLRIFIAQEQQPEHAVTRDLASYGSLQLGVKEAPSSAVGVPAYQPYDQRDANDFHFSMSYRFDF